MAQTLHLMNAPEIDAKITAAGSRIDGLIARKATPRQIVDELCLSALGRPPNDREVRAAEKLVSPLGGVFGYFLLIELEKRK